ncbi:MAG: molybdopterin-dependent oxidoreductase [Syntrophobacterales bacterium]|jgi:xanthine dehydrogenase molybdenum-binding subunit|nr:molybdopterin-dependent oxidoreductase [Syntrophobacterales bacterium]
MKSVGKSVKRLDAIDKVTGIGTFTTDFTLPGMLFGKVLRSPHPHARIAKIDTSRAEKFPGVKVVLTHKNTPKNLFNTSATMTFTVPQMKPVLDQRIFDDRVRYVGDEVAAIAATSEAIAKEALKLIDVEYELLPAVYDPLLAMEDSAPAIHHSHAGKNIPGDIVRIPFNSVEEGFKSSDVIVESTFKLQVQKHAQLETQAAVASVDGKGNLTVWCTTQTPHPTKMILSAALGIPNNKIRVLNPPYAGGGFGVRIGCSAKAEPIAAVLALATQKPVKVVYSREEDFIASDTRHSGYVAVKLGAKKDGTFQALDVKATLNTGAYCSFGVETPGVLGAMGLAAYNVPHRNYYGHSVYTNITPAGAFRGFGAPQGTSSIESVVDMMAEKLGIDPVELRLKNIMKVGDPWHLPFECKSTGMAECVKEGAKKIGWESRGKLKSDDPNKRRGIGMGIAAWVSNSWPFCVDYDNAYLSMHQDGSLQLSVGAPEIGCGSGTSLAQLAADTLGVPFEAIDVTQGDTAMTPFSIGSHASRTLYATGTAVVAAAENLKQEILKYAAETFDIPLDNLDIVGANIVKVDNTVVISVNDLAVKAHLLDRQFIGVGQTIPSNASPMQAHFAEVEVDLTTGKVDVIKIVAAHDVGKAINPAIVEGQIEGGALMGVGYAISEEVVYDDKGKQQNYNYHYYLLPTAADRPEIEAIIVESNDPTGPFGAKGVGETGMIPTGAAILNAVTNAIGVRPKELPLSGEKMFKLLKENNLFVS